METVLKDVTVTLIPDYFFPIFYGAEMHVYALAQKLLEKKINVNILTRNVPKLVRNHQDMYVYGFPSLFAQYHRYMKGYYLPLFDPTLSLAPIFKKNYFEKSIVHAHGPIILSIAASKTWSNFPLLLSVHDYWPVCFQRSLFLPNRKVCNLNENCAQCLAPHMGKMGHLSNFVNSFNSVLLKKVDRFIAVSQFVKNSLIRGGLPAKKIDVVHNWVSLQNLDRYTGDISENKRNIILFVGQVSTQKGVHVAVDSMSHVSKEISDFEFHIVGSGPLTPVLKKQVKKEGLSDNVFFLGKVSQETLFNEYRRAKMFVCPSLWPDPCPTVILEAMAFKLPIVASNVGGIPELVNHGFNGFLFPAGEDAILSEHLLTLLSDDALCMRLGENSKSAVKSFDIDFQLSKILDLYSTFA